MCFNCTRFLKRDGANEELRREKMRSNQGFFVSVEATRKCECDGDEETETTTT